MTVWHRFRDIGNKSSVRLSRSLEVMERGTNRQLYGISCSYVSVWYYF